MASVIQAGAPLIHRPAAASAWSQGLAAAGSVLRVYAQILFARSPLAGLLVLLATATVPRALAFGLLGVTSAAVFARLLSLDAELIEEGTYGTSALLVSLGVGLTFGGPTAALFVVVAFAPACVLLTAALRGLLGASLNLPVLSVPFLVVFHLVLGVAVFAGLTPAPHVDLGSPLDAMLPVELSLFVRSLGALFFLPSVPAGALVLAGLVAHSRIAASVAALAFALVLVLARTALSLPGDETVLTLGYNAMLTAMALGAVWFVPSPSSFLLGLFGALISTLVAVGTLVPLAKLGVPSPILPFNATVLLSLVALRQRAADGLPKAVDFLSGTPEENLAYFRTRLARFRWLYPVSFRLPFRGAWSCTQGEDGAITHQGPHRHAFDFEVMGSDGKPYEGSGTEADDFHAHRLPVLAAADGTVIDFASEIADGPVGSVDLEKNWGNFVLLYHAPGLYSLVAHLAKGSVKVALHQAVRRGDVLGLCGNSGRSPQPHLHFQLQSAPLLGAPTLPCRFNDVVREGEGEGQESRLELGLVPVEGDLVRNVAPEEDVAGFLRFHLGAGFRLQIGKKSERVVVDVDVAGRLRLFSPERGSSLYYASGEDFFTSFDRLGKSEALDLFAACLSRVPFDASESLEWVDVLPARRFRRAALRWLGDFFAPFRPNDGVEMRYRMAREGGRLVVTGASRSRAFGGKPLVRTRAELDKRLGPVRLEVTVRGEMRVAERVTEQSMVGDSTFSKQSMEES